MPRFHSVPSQLLPQTHIIADGVGKHSRPGAIVGSSWGPIHGKAIGRAPRWMMPGAVERFAIATQLLGPLPSGKRPATRGEPTQVPETKFQRPLVTGLSGSGLFCICRHHAMRLDMVSCYEAICPLHSPLGRVCVPSGGLLVCSCYPPSRHHSWDLASLVNGETHRLAVNVTVRYSKACVRA